MPERKLNRTFHRFVVVMVANLLFTVAAVAFVTVRFDDRTRQDAADLADRRVSACERGNDTAAGLRLMAVTSANGWESFAGILLQGETPDPESETGQQVAAFEATVVAPLRQLADPDTGPFADLDCTLAAIETRTTPTSAP